MEKWAHGDTDCPPNNCIPNNAKTTMKRKSRNSKLTMDFMEFRRETTRFRRGAQYLRSRLKKKNHLTVFNNVQKTIQINRLKLGKIFEISLYLVTLKMRSSRRARNTLIPKDVPGLMVAHTTSKMLPTITCRHTTRHDTVCWLHWGQWVELKKEKRLNLCYWHLPLSS